MSHPKGESAPLIEAVELKKVYAKGKHETLALDTLSFTVANGESLAIVGPSGSGKSTLLQILGGLDSPTSGHVSVVGQRLDALSDRKLAAFRNQTIGFVFQFFNLQSYFTARENVALPLMLAGVRTQAAFARAEVLLERVGLRDRMDHTPAGLSGGEMQRVAVARALINNPKLILADEPTGNLDAENAASVLKLLKDITEDGTSVVVITHDPLVAKAFPKQLKLNKGKVVA